MQSHALLLSLVRLAYSLVVEKSNTNEIFKRDAKCYSGPTGYNNQGALHHCVLQLQNNTHWGTFDCASRSFFLGGQWWDSPADCIGGCTPCLTGAADLGLHWAKCDQQTGVSAHCWVGWCPDGLSPGGNSDGSCS